MRKVFVGFGFGPIQAGLFLYEAHRSGAFRRLVVSEVDAELVEPVRRNSGHYAMNIARQSGIEPVTVPGVELLSPRDPQDREALVAAIAEADEMATALPSVDIYTAGGEASAASLLRDGLARRHSPLSTVVYAAENHNHAAEILRERLAQGGCPGPDSLQVLNTVIGKMSGVITDAATIKRLNLALVAPGVSRAILVEEFNRILISAVTLPGYRRGITVFSEKPDLLPFEEAKLYGHNAIHALIAYLGGHKGYSTMAEAGADGTIAGIAREAFLDESGAALVRRHGDTGDPLFTPEGYAAYADDLLERMRNP